MVQYAVRVGSGPQTLVEASAPAPAASERVLIEGGGQVFVRDLRTGAVKSYIAEVTADRKVVALYPGPEPLIGYPAVESELASPALRSLMRAAGDAGDLTGPLLRAASNPRPELLRKIAAVSEGIRRLAEPSIGGPIRGLLDDSHESQMRIREIEANIQESVSRESMRSIMADFAALPNSLGVPPHLLNGKGNTATEASMLNAAAARRLASERGNR